MSSLTRHRRQRSGSLVRKGEVVHSVPACEILPAETAPALCAEGR